MKVTSHALFTPLNPIIYMYLKSTKAPAPSYTVSVQGGIKSGPEHTLYQNLLPQTMKPNHRITKYHTKS